MFIYIFEDGSLVYSKDEPTELDLHCVLEYNNTIIRTDTPTPQEYTQDGVWENIAESRLRHDGAEPYHSDPYDEYEDEEENE